MLWTHTVRDRAKRISRSPSPRTPVTLRRAKSMRRVVAFVSLTVCISGCAARAPVATPSARSRVLETREGLASYYGKEFNGRLTASGIRFDMNALVAAHPVYPFGTLLRVTNVANGRSTNVRIVDRGPTPQIQADGVLIDLSRRAAEVLA